MSKRLRLDQLLVEKGLFASREQAQRAVMAGEVKVGTRIAAKPSQLLELETAITVRPTQKYVGRGALKLESALDHFNIDVQGRIGYRRIHWRFYGLPAAAWCRKGLRRRRRAWPT